MNSILSILCITFFSLLTYAVVSGYNLQKKHKYDCKTIIIPEDMDIDTALESVRGLTMDQLKKRAHKLGATTQFLDSSDDITLKMFIIQNSVSDDNIVTNDIEGDLMELEIDRNLLGEYPERVVELEPISIDIREPSLFIEALKEDLE